MCSLSEQVKGDVFPTVRLRTEAERLIADAYNQSATIMTNSAGGELEKFPGCNTEETLENSTLGVLNTASEINVAQMIALVGQQMVSGKRVPGKYGGDKLDPAESKRSRFKIRQEDLGIDRTTIVVRVKAACDVATRDNENARSLSTTDEFPADLILLRSGQRIVDLLKDLVKAINTFLDDPSLPLPESLLGTINALLQCHEEDDDDAATDQLQESLLSIFSKRVRDNGQAPSPWMAIIRRLLPLLRTPEKILPWFGTCEDILDKQDVDSCFVEETVAALMEITTILEEWQASVAGAPASKLVIRRVLGLWIDRFYPALLDGNPTSEYNERFVRLSLSNLGRKRPREVFAAVDDYLVQKTHRKSALRFLCDFIQGQPPRLHEIADTQLFLDLLTCLRQDTSTTIVSAALTTLIMLLPHMPSSLVPHLPALFTIYGRLLFWDRAHSRPMITSPDHERGGTDTASRWEVATFDTGVDDQSIAHLPHYFTILYGLYPINFMDYIRKPQRYMRHANASHADDLEVQPTEMRHRSERFQHNHLLHANFYSLTVDSEKTDTSRWIKSEAAEVVAECMALCLETDMHAFGDPSTALSEPGGVQAGTNNIDHDTTDDGSKADVALLAGSGGKRDSWRHSHPTLTSSDSMSSNQTPAIMMRRGSQSSVPSHIDYGDGSRPRLPGTSSPTLTLSSSHTQLQDLIQSNKVIKSGFHQSPANESTPFLAPGHDESMAERIATGISPADMAMAPPPLPSSSLSPTPASKSESSTQVAHLQKLILLLQNDLSFERYLKQQHMAHIGEIRRMQMSDAATEAETQNLIIMNRNLKSRFEDAKKSEMQAKKESERSREIAKKWEATLAHKLKTLRDESNKTQGAMETLQKELAESKSKCKKLRALFRDAEKKALGFQQTVQSLEMDGTQVESLKLEVETLTRSERDHQASEVARAEAVKSATEAGNQAEVLRMKLAALQNDVQRTKKLFQAQIQALQAQLSEAQEERERPGANTNIAVETALAASRAKQAELQKQYSLLMRKYTALQSSLLDMQSEHEQAQHPHPHQHRPLYRSGPLTQQQPADAAPDYLSFSSSPMMIKSRPDRAPSSAEAMSHNMASPVGSSDAATSPGDAAAQAEASGYGSAAMPISRMSPDQRHFGRCPPRTMHSVHASEHEDVGGVLTDIGPTAGFPRLRRESRDKSSKDDGGTGSGKAKKEKKGSGLRGIRGFV
ncbi:hypothetical protein E4U53_006008 [Claviceps sorghi]|nr:hypothetical protein E4U53_006008 [Claviceps sorghi]